MIRKNLIRNASVFLVIATSAISLQAQEEVVLNPVQLSGELKLGSDPLDQDLQLSRIDIRVNANGAVVNNRISPPAPPSNTLPYTFNIDVPVGSSTNATLSAYVTTDADKDRYNLITKRITLFDGQPISGFDLANANPGFVSGNVTINGGTANFIRLNIRRKTAALPTELIGDSSTLLTRDERNFRFAMDEGLHNFSGEVVLTNGSRISIPIQDINIIAGQETVLNVTVDAPPTGSVIGAISLQGSEIVLDYVVRLIGDSVSKFSTFPAIDNTVNYEFLDIAEGVSRLDLIARFVDSDTNITKTLQLPSSFFENIYDPKYSVQVNANEASVVNFNQQQSHINTKVSLSGAVDNQHLGSRVLSLRYKKLDEQALTHASDALALPVTENDSFNHVVTQGKWAPNLFHYGVENLSADPEVYFNVDATYLILNPAGVTPSVVIELQAGETLDRTFDIETGQVKVRAQIIGGGVFSNPSAKTRCSILDDAGQRLVQSQSFAISENQVDVTEGVVNIISPPGNCLLTVSAFINGLETVIVGNVPLTIIPGVDQEIDIGAPLLTVTSPAPDTVVNVDTVTVVGTSVDETEVASVTVNGIEAVLVPDVAGNLSSVSFSVPDISLVEGQNTITTVTTDTAGNQASETRTVIYEILNIAPVANDQNVSVNEDSNISITLTATDDDLLSYSIVSNPSNGVLSINADGSYTYTPSENYNGPDSFTFSASDGALDSNVATVSINVVSVNDAPTATSGNLITDENVAVSGLVVASDIDSTTLTYAVGTTPTSGSVLINADGSYVYTPNAGFFGTDSFSLVVSDGQDSVTVNVSVTVTAAPPSACNDDDYDDDDHDSDDNDDCDDDDSDSDGGDDRDDDDSDSDDGDDRDDDDSDSDDGDDRDDDDSDSDDDDDRDDDDSDSGDDDDSDNDD